MPERGARVTSGYKMTLFEAWGSDAERVCNEWIQTHRPTPPYRLEYTERATPEEEEARERDRRAQQRRKGKQTMPTIYDEDDESPKGKGAQMGEMFARITSGDDSLEVLMFFGTLFARLDGYQDMRYGNKYMMSFCQAFGKFRKSQTPQALPPNGGTTENPD